MLASTPAVRTSATLAAVILAALLLAGCGQDDDPSVATTSAAPTSAVPSSATPTAPAPTATATPSASASTTPVDQEITVTIAKGRVDPPTGRITVSKGKLIRITVTSDVSDELHVHGYDVGARLPAGTPGSVEFRADQTGLFEVETHDSELVLFQLVVR
ncbi:hypothetical protein [Micromonospora inaquosa]|uniref:EfeO-type cupredoxin-like domain-containing protein n=1 Tax=Micromonospora inaquosa TaxID=2203716 RepID=A0A3N9X9A1_9ACTN|nr:hypothetical protein [Micromonospora inaquosa]RQX03983.1 hypothetical protein DLJ59_10915 [Micromonospora inaquosa]